MKANNYNLSLACFQSILMLLLVTSMLIISPRAHAVVNESEAREAAYQYCEEQLGYAKKNLEIYDLSLREGGGWAFGIRALEDDKTLREIIRGELDTNGKILSLVERGNVTVTEQIQEDLWRSSRSYEAMYAFKTKWDIRLPQVNKKQNDDFDMKHNISLTALIRHDIRLPSPTDISYEEAKKKSEEAILALPGWTQEMLDQIRINLEVYHVPVGSDRPVYQFVYKRASAVGHVESLFSDEDYDATYYRLEEAENRVFGKANPWHVNVRIDARTGELVGDIYVDIPPTMYRDTDFILWK